jgi:predicted ATPase
VGVDLGARSGPEVRFLRRDGAELELADLSEQEQDAVLFAVMFDLLGLARAIILVDRPELFVAPEDQLRFLCALGSLGEDAQILAATTSEPILAAAEPSAVVRLEGRAAGG